MYISELKISNFRCFDGTEHIIRFNKGLSVLVGENDSGKTAIIDAIRIALDHLQYVNKQDASKKRQI